MRKTTSESDINTPKPQSNRALKIWIAVICLAAILPYIPSLIHGGFALDDEFLILNDPLAHTLANIPKAFQTDFLHGNLGCEKPYYYRPLITISFQIDYAIARNHPLFYRLVNLGLELAIVLLVFALARRITKSDLAGGVSALVFAVLPCHAESVAWISGRTDLISTFFILSSVVVFARVCDSGFRWGGALLCTVLFGCALFSKESGTTVPLLMLMYMWVMNIKLPWKTILRWAVVLLPMMILWWAVRHSVVGNSLEEYVKVLFWRRIGGVGLAYAAYLRMLFIPQELRIIYDVFIIGTEHPWIANLAWFFPISLLTLSVWARKRARAVSFGAMWILLGLLPVTNILPAISPLPAERFAYLASAGSSMILGWLALKMLEWQPAGIRTWKSAAIIIICGFILYSGALVVPSASKYDSNLNWSLDFIKYNSRFSQLRSTAGQNLAMNGYLERGIQEMEASIKLDRFDQLDDTAYMVCGIANRRFGNESRCLELLKIAEKKFGKNAKISFEMGVSSATLGDIPSAIKEFSESVRLDPKLRLAWRNLARACLLAKRYDEAIRAYKQDAALGPLDSRDHYELGMAYKDSGMHSEALKELNESARMDPKGEWGAKALKELSRP